MSGPFGGRDSELIHLFSYIFLQTFGAAGKRGWRELIGRKASGARQAAKPLVQKRGNCGEKE